MSQSPVLDEKTSFLITDIGGGAHVNLSNSLEASASVSSIDLNLSEKGSDINVSRLVEASLCASPGKTNVGRKGFVQRTRRSFAGKKDSGKISDSLNSLFRESDENDSHVSPRIAADSVSRKKRLTAKNVKESNFQLAFDSSSEENMSYVGDGRKLSAFYKRAKNVRVSSSNNNFQNAFDSSTDKSGIQTTPRRCDKKVFECRTSKRKLPNNNSNADGKNLAPFKDMDSLSAITEKDAPLFLSPAKVNGKKKSFIYRTRQQSQKKEFKHNLSVSLNTSDSFSRYEKLNAKSTDTNVFQAALESSGEMNVSDMVHHRASSAFCKKRKLTRKSSCKSDFQTAFALSPSVQHCQSKENSSHISQNESNVIESIDKESGDRKHLKDSENVINKVQEEKLDMENREQNVSQVNSNHSSENNELNKEKSENSCGEKSSEHLVLTAELGDSTDRIFSKVSDEVKDTEVSHNELPSLQFQTDSPSLVDKTTDVPDITMSRPVSRVSLLPSIKISQDGSGLSREISQRELCRGRLTNDEDKFTRFHDLSYSPLAAHGTSFEKTGVNLDVPRPEQLSAVMPNEDITNNSAKLDKSLSQPSAILHIESDYNSLQSSSDSEVDEESERENRNSKQKDENSTKVSNVNSGKVNSANSVNITNSFVEERSRDIALSELDVNTINRSRSLLRKSRNSSSRGEETFKRSSLSLSLTKRFPIQNENFDSMNMTNDSDKSKSLCVTFSKSVSTHMVEVHDNTLTRSFEGRNSIGTHKAEVNQGLTNGSVNSVSNSSSSSKTLDNRTESGSSKKYNSPRQASLRKRTSKDSHDKLNQENLSSPDSDNDSVFNNSLSEVSRLSDNGISKSSDKSKKRKSLRNKSNRSSFKNVTPKFSSINSDSSALIEIPCSELRGNHKNTSNYIKQDLELLNEKLTFEENKKSSRLSMNKDNENDENRAGNVSGNISLGQSKVPKLKKPKIWVTKHLYKFITDKLECKYGIKSRNRAEKFVLFLCEKFNVVSKLVDKEDYKSQVDYLIIEMARLRLIETYHDFYIFVQRYLPHSFAVKSIPMFYKCPLVDPLPKGKVFASIL